MPKTRGGPSPPERPAHVDESPSPCGSRFLPDFLLSVLSGVFYVLLPLADLFCLFGFFICSHVSVHFPLDRGIFDVFLQISNRVHFDLPDTFARALHAFGNFGKDFGRFAV